MDTTAPASHFETFQQDRRIAARCHVPELFCSVQPRIHPDYPSIDERNAGWVRAFLPFPDEAARRQFLEYRFPQIDTMFFPLGLTDRVFQSSCVTSVISAIDDLPPMQHVIWDAETPRLVANHLYGQAFSNIWGILRESMPVSIYNRYCHAWRLCLDSLAREGELEAKGEILDLEGYLELGQVNVGLRAYTTFAEYVLDLDLTDIADDPELKRLITAVCEYGLLVNAVYSYPKEQAAGQTFNVITSLRCAHGCDLQQAVDLVCERIRVADRLRSDLSEVLFHRYGNRFGAARFRAYLDTIGTICSGALRWTLESSRYARGGQGWDWIRSREIVLDSAAA